MVKTHTKPQLRLKNTLLFNSKTKSAKQSGFSLAIVLIFVLALSLLATSAVQMAQVETLASIHATQSMQAEAKAMWALANAERDLQGLPSLVWSGDSPAPEATSERLLASDLGLDEEEAATLQIYRIQAQGQVAKSQVRLEALFTLSPSAQRLSVQVLE